MKRYYELDSVRGLAALSVLFAHYLAIFNSSMVTKAIEYGPFRLFVSGNEAVLLFFLLSGFVLSLPFLKGKEINLRSYRDFAIKRVARIYLPYLVAIIGAILCNYFLYKGNVEILSKWFNNRWSQPVTWDSIVQHIIFLGEYPKQFNVVTWSLVEELRISLIFPVLMILVLRFNWKGSLLLVGSLYSLSIIIRLLLGSGYDGIANTIHYSTIFIIGALIAKHKDDIIHLISNLSRIKKILFVITGLFLYLYAKPSFAINMFFKFDTFYRERIDFFLIIAGAVMIVVSALSFSFVTKLLLQRHVHFIGKISYSVYLYHLFILLSFVYLFNSILPIWAILVLSFATTILISSASYYFIELPSINLGKSIVSRLAKNERENIAA